MCEQRLRWRHRICWNEISTFLYERLGEKGYLLNGQGGFGNHLTSVGAKDVDTKDAVGFSVRKEFDLH